MKQTSQRVSQQVLVPGAIKHASSQRTIVDDHTYISIADLRQMAVKSTRSVAAQLLRAQECERRRVARDLHDVINQKLAILVLELGQLTRDADANPVLQEHLMQLRDQAEGITREVRNLSHQLHSATLEHLGLVSALRSHCRQIEKLEAVGITFEVGCGIGKVEPEVELCLYRIAQEALKNAVTHAKAINILVRLDRCGRLLVLEVTDDGKGFDVRSVRHSSGIGLASMEERARLVGADLRVHSAPGRGTTVTVTVPVANH